MMTAADTCLAHSQMRIILSRYLDAKPENISFQQGKYGKPYLVQKQQLRFSLSHSHNLAVLALSEKINLGIDIEYVRPVAESVADQFFSFREQEHLLSCRHDPGAWLDAFYSCWTRKEPFLKALD
jgi:4'-phosphopantetheinyl transferase